MGMLMIYCSNFWKSEKVIILPSFLMIFSQYKISRWHFFSPKSLKRLFSSPFVCLASSFKCAVTSINVSLWFCHCMLLISLSQILGSLIIMCLAVLYLKFIYCLKFGFLESICLCFYHISDISSYITFRMCSFPCNY